MPWWTQGPFLAEPLPPAPAPEDPPLQQGWAFRQATHGAVRAAAAAAPLWGFWKGVLRFKGTLQPS